MSDVAPGATPEPTPVGATPEPAPAAPPAPAAQANASANNAGTGVTPKPEEGETPEPENPKDSPHKTVQELRDDLARANARIRELNGESREHRQKAQIADADRAELEAFRKIGLKPETVRERLQQGQQVATENATLKRDGLLRDVAGPERANVKFGILKDLDGKMAAQRGEPLRYESREVEVNGKKERREFVVYKEKTADGEADKAEPFDDFAAREWPDYLPALRTGPARPAGTQVIRQASSEGAPAASAARHKPGGLF